jgi:hypothetical protein
MVSLMNRTIRFLEAEEEFIHKGFKDGVINIDYIDINVQTGGIVSRNGNYF